MVRVGIYLGTSSDNTENIERILLSWGEYLSSEFAVDVFGTAPLPKSSSGLFNYIKLDEEEHSTPFSKIMAVYRQTEEYILEYSPDVLIQLWKFNTHATGVACAGARYDTPTVIRYSGATFDSYQTHHGITRFGVFFLNNVVNRLLALKLCDQAIALGPNGKAELSSRGVDDDRITILPPTLDREGRFHPPEDKSALREQLGLPKDRRIALYVGRITEKKGMEFFKDVVSDLDGLGDIQFILVGEGDLKRDFEIGFDTNRVRMIGRIPYSEIDKYYKASDLYIHPSPLEGIPLVLLEAMECGLPVIARRAGDIPFITPNVVDTSEEMASIIKNQSWSDEFLHREYFSDDFQQKTIMNMLSEITKSH